MGRIRRYWWAWSAGLMLLGLAHGCREELEPRTFPTTRVSGFVREGGRPVGGGWIEFHPANGTVGDLRSAPIRRDGSFVADRVAVGTNQVRLVDTPAGSPLAHRFAFDSTFKPIRRAIPAGPSSTLSIDLVEEAIRQRPAAAPDR